MLFNHRIHCVYTTWGNERIPLFCSFISLPDSIDGQLLNQPLFTIVVIVIIQRFQSTDIVRSLDRTFSLDLLHRCPVTENEWIPTRQ